MSYKGRVRNGVVVLEDGVELPENLEVTVDPVNVTSDHSSLRDGLRRFAGQAKGLPSDSAENHDHYLHGTPKP